MSARPLASLRPDTGQIARDLVAGMAGLLAVVAALDAALHLGGGVATPDLATVFDATSERGLASFLSVTQAALIAATLLGMSALYRAARRPHRGWAALAALFAYLAVDDGVRLHEGVGTAFAASGLRALAGGFPSYYWQLLFGPLFAAAGLAMLVFLWRELGTARRRALVVAAFGLLACAVGLDFVDGLSANHPGNVYARLAETDLAAGLGVAAGLSPFDLVVHLSRVVEESFETFAFTLLWAAFVLHLGTTLGGVAVRFGAHAPPADRLAPAAPAEAAPAWIARPQTRRAGAPRDATPA